MKKSIPEKLKESQPPQLLIENALGHHPELFFKIEAYSFDEKIQWLKQNKADVEKILVTPDGRVRQDAFDYENDDYKLLSEILKIIADNIYQELSDDAKSLRNEQKLGTLYCDDGVREVPRLDQAVIVAYPEILEQLYLKHPKWVEKELSKKTLVINKNLNLGQRIFFKMLQYNNTYIGDRIGKALFNFVANHKSILFQEFQEVVNTVELDTHIVEYLFRANSFSVFRFLNLDDLNDKQKKMAVAAAFLNLNSSYTEASWSFKLIEEAPLVLVEEAYRKIHAKLESEDTEKIDIIIERRKLGANLKSANQAGSSEVSENNGIIEFNKLGEIRMDRKDAKKLKI